MKTNPYYRALYTKSGDNFLPVVMCCHTGETEVLYGDPLCNRKTAIKYAKIEANRRNEKIRNNQKG
jgi:hypothetical protein